MGNKTSKPASRQTSASSTTPMTNDISNPTTPTPLLTNFPEHTPRSTPHGSAHSSASKTASSPMTPATPIFIFPSPLCNTPNEIVVSGFAGDSPSDSRSASLFGPQSSPTLQTGTLDEIQHISQPKPSRPHIRHLSELIDPAMLVDDDAAVRSPSGHMLDRRAYVEREDRPLSMRERQERVRHQVMLQRSQGNLREMALATNASQDDATKRPSTLIVTGSVGKRKKRCTCFGT
ncbi:hypothetical protein AAFC00_006249 [Neodothiora populina]|uniref:Uncharacterized protein n=1 Tax=Neodothiora populina TaxID=2781224 RepID=A0ABR3P4T7_9PEZI